MKTICLNMIVKNESSVILRCLASVKPIIDYWVIADTGSSDGTQSLILEFMRDIPGELHERPWVDFALNRNEALDFAKDKGDYLLFIDADEQLQFFSTFDKAFLDKDYYLIKMIGQTSEFTKMFLIKNDSSWSWKGVIHESIGSVKPVSGELLSYASIQYDELSGHRAQDPQKYLKDAQILEKVLAADPCNTRSLFYLAQSYAHAKEYSLALKYYQQRVLLGGSREEVFWSLYCIGCLQEDLGMAPEQIITSYSKACQFDPTRAEPVYRLAVYLKDQPLLSYLLIKRAMDIPIPYNAARLQSWIYEDLPLRFAEYSYLTGNYEESYRTHELLLAKELPVETRAMLEENMGKLRSILLYYSKNESPRYLPLSAVASRPLEL